MSLRAVVNHFRDTFSSVGSGEAVRAFFLFGVLLLSLVGFLLHFTFRELSLKVLTDKVDLGRHEAERIAAVVEGFGAEDGGIDFSRVRQNRQALQDFIGQRIAGRIFISQVEIRDRFAVGPRQNISRARQLGSLRDSTHGLVPRVWQRSFRSSCRRRHRRRAG